MPLCSPSVPPSTTDRPQLVALDAVDTQLNVAVVEKQHVAWRHGRRQVVGRRDREAAAFGSTANEIADDKIQRVAGLQLDRLVMLQLAGANLWTAEVLHYGHIPSRLFGGSANARDRRAVRLMSAVREIQSKDIHARTDQRANRFRRCRSMDQSSR